MDYDSSSINSYTGDENKQIWFSCDDYNKLVTVQQRYLRNQITSSPTYSNQLKSETSSILRYSLRLTEIYQLFIVRWHSCLSNESTKQREFVIAFGLKQLFTEIIPSNTENNRVNDGIHLCISNCSGNVIYCSHANNVHTCSINVGEAEHLDSESNCKSWIVKQVVGGSTMLNQILKELESGLNPILYKFLLNNCYLITAVDLQFGRKDFLFLFLDQFLSNTTILNKNSEDDETLDDEIVQALRLQNPAKILSSLYLSSIHPAQNLILLKQLNINFILNLTGYKHNSNELRYQINYPPEITVLHVKIADEMDTKISDYFDQALHFMETSIGKNSSNRILVHCEAGISRSATVVIAYLMQFHSKSLKSAYELVKQSKKNVAPNISFFQELIQFEKQLNVNNNNDKNNHWTPSISLNDYIVQQMSEGVALGFTRDQIIEALEKTNYQPNAASILLFQNS